MKTHAYLFSYKGKKLTFTRGQVGEWMSTDDGKRFDPSIPDHCEAVLDMVTSIRGFLSDRQKEQLSMMKDKKFKSLFKEIK